MIIKIMDKLLYTKNFITLNKDQQSEPIEFKTAKTTSK